uniref:PiggyBac transposable element-derived protein domain-containing protein n=1 Tax=Ditylenchus dipsaci TaxID=166011 RepID=A0A915DJL3_9BILA
MHLARPFLGCKRTMVTDNFFTSSELGLNLLTQNTYLLGTMRKGRKGTPTDFIDEKLELGKVRFAFRQHETIVKFQAKKTKQVNLYSTTHHDEQMHQRVAVPCAYVLTPAMNEIVYATTIDALIDLLDPGRCPERVMSDFELAPLKSFQALLPTADLSEYRARRNCYDISTATALTNEKL